MKGEKWIWIFLILCTGLVIAELSEESLKAKESLELVNKDLKEMQAEYISTTRYNDTLFLAKQIYNAQRNVEKKGGKPDYSPFYDKVNKLGEIKQNAFLTLDELKALEITINQTEGIDLGPVWELYHEAKDEFNSERYEKSLELVDETYEKISELQAVQTKIKVFYEATSRTIVNFLKRRWKEITAVVVTIFLLLFFSYNRFVRHRTKRNISRLERRKKSIKELIAETQRDYLGRGKISSVDYHIRMKKYGDMIRDINRQIPLLKEELAKTGKEKNKYLTKKVWYISLVVIALAIGSIVFFRLFRKNMWLNLNKVADKILPYIEKIWQKASELAPMLWKDILSFRKSIPYFDLWLIVVVDILVIIIVVTYLLRKKAKPGTKKKETLPEEEKKIPREPLPSRREPEREAKEELQMKTEMMRKKTVKKRRTIIKQFWAKNKKNIMAVLVSLLLLAGIYLLILYWGKEILSFIIDAGKIVWPVLIILKNMLIDNYIVLLSAAFLLIVGGVVAYLITKKRKIYSSSARKRSLKMPSAKEHKVTEHKVAEHKVAKHKVAEHTIAEHQATKHPTKLSPLKRKAPPVKKEKRLFQFLINVEEALGKFLSEHKKAIMIVLVSLLSVLGLGLLVYYFGSEILSFVVSKGKALRLGTEENLRIYGIYLAAFIIFISSIIVGLKIAHLIEKRKAKLSPAHKRFLKIPTVEEAKITERPQKHSPVKRKKMKIRKGLVVKKIIAYLLVKKKGFLVRKIKVFYLQYLKKFWVKEKKEKEEKRRKKIIIKSGIQPPTKKRRFLLEFKWTLTEIRKFLKKVKGLSVRSRTYFGKKIVKIRERRPPRPKGRGPTDIFPKPKPVRSKEVHKKHLLDQKRLAFFRSKKRLYTFGLKAKVLRLFSKTKEFIEFLIKKKDLLVEFLKEKKENYKQFLSRNKKAAFTVLFSLFFIILASTIVNYFGKEIFTFMVDAGKAALSGLKTVFIDYGVYWIAFITFLALSYLGAKYIVRFIKKLAKNEKKPIKFHEHPLEIQVKEKLALAQQEVQVPEAVAPVPTEQVTAPEPKQEVEKVTKPAPKRKKKLSLEEEYEQITRELEKLEEE